ncbi:MAG: hypothetical protein ACOY9Y_10845 [Bacillota bacterium]
MIAEVGRRPWGQPEVIATKKRKSRRDKYKICPPEPLYIALADLDFTWYADEVTQVIRWWEDGIALGDMADRLRRDPDEVAILLIDLARAGKIKERDGGVYGKLLCEDGQRSCKVK